MTSKEYLNSHKRERIAVFMSTYLLRHLKLKKYIVLSGIIIGLSAFLIPEFSQDSFAQYMGNVGSNNTNSDDKTISPPLKQLRDGYPLKDIKCKSNLEMLIKDHGIPICVTPTTKVILMERLGWTEPENLSTYSSNQDNNIHAEKFPYKFDKEIFSADSTQTTSEDIIKFSSPAEIVEFLNEAQAFRGNLGYNQLDEWMSGEEISITVSRGSGEFVLEEALEIQRRQIEAGPAVPSHTGAVSLDRTIYSENYSATNVQVKNVDEPDYLKTDGKYIYIVNQNTLTIIDAYPAESAKIIYKAALDIESQDLENIFLNDDRLVIMYRGSSMPHVAQTNISDDEDEQTSTESTMMIMPYPIYNSATVVSVLDISDRQNPQILSEYNIDGNYHDSRMIDNIVYIVANSRADYTNPIIPRVAIPETDTIIMPDIYRFPNPEQRYNFNTITAIDIIADDLINSETFLMGNTNTLYVSEDNLYITYQKNITPKTVEQIQREIFLDVILPLLTQDTQDQITSVYDDDSITPIQKQSAISEILQEAYNTLPKQDRDDLFSKMQDAIKEFDFQLRHNLSQTAIHKIALDDGNMTYVANAHVPGYLLNQFSMDEYDEKFRVATTIQDNFRRGGGDSDTANNVYVLDKSLERIGSLEDIAPGETIYSARFMGDQLYLVTFKQIDPFFVIDLSEDTPKVLGELKIPGFSNYLQPYDEDHIIGIGRDTIETKGRVQTEGIKISMFDVSDFENPKEKDTIIIGNDWTESDILYDHKALLLDKQKDVMSIPIKTSIIAFEDEPSTSVTDDDDYYYDRYWNGFYIYGFDENGFVEKGTITHYQYQDHYNFPYMEPRSLYIDDALYTVMDGSLKINDINNIEDELKSISLANTGKIIGFVE